MKKTLITIIAAMTMLFAFTITSLAAETTYSYGDLVLEDIREHETYKEIMDEYPYVVIYGKSSPRYIYVSANPFYINDMIYGNTVKTTGTLYHALAYPESGNVAAFLKTELTTETALTGIDNVVWSSHDILTADGTIAFEGDPVFLPAPLWEMVITLAGQEMTVVLPQMGGTMKTLAVCGVGLMALLIVLRLFGKRSLLFLKR